MSSKFTHEEPTQTQNGERAEELLLDGCGPDELLDAEDELLEDTGIFTHLHDSQSGM
jgi:hypothetical protein